jgi:SAM-dependent methyltransferase
MSRPSPLLAQWLPELRAANQLGPVADLACGRGRNGLALTAQGLDVVFIDRDEEALQEIAKQASSAVCRHVDLEAGETGTGLQPAEFGAIIVFNYLHRPLFAQLKQAIAPGGLVLYETFTHEQPRFGRPSNPDFLLRFGELAAQFESWEQLAYFEGIKPKDSGAGDKAAAYIVARKP